MKGDENLKMSWIDELFLKHRLPDGDTVFLIVNAPDGTDYISVGELDYTKHPDEHLKAILCMMEHLLDNPKVLMDVPGYSGLKTDSEGMVIDES